MDEDLDGLHTVEDLEDMLVSGALGAGEHEDEAKDRGTTAAGRAAHHQTERAARLSWTSEVLQSHSSMTKAEAAGRGKPGSRRPRERSASRSVGTGHAPASSRVSGGSEGQHSASRGSSRQQQVRSPRPKNASEKRRGPTKR